MKHEKIFKRSDGTQYKISTEIYIRLYGDHGPSYYFSAKTRGKGKRKWLSVYDFDGDYMWRKKTMEKRAEFRKKKYLEFVTCDEVNEVYDELYQKLKPPAVEKLKQEEK